MVGLSGAPALWVQTGRICDMQGQGFMSQTRLEYEARVPGRSTCPPIQSKRPCFLGGGAINRAAEPRGIWSQSVAALFVRGGGLV